MRLLDFLLAAGVLAVLSSCASSKAVQVLDPSAMRAEIESANTITLDSIKLGGALEGISKNNTIYHSFLGSFAEFGESIKCSREDKYSDGTLFVSMKTEYSSTGMTKAKYVPLYGGLVHTFSGGTLAFKWKATVTYSLHDTEGKKVSEGSFQMKAVDADQQKGGYTAGAGSMLTGAGPQAMFYPGPDDMKRVADKFLRSAGREIANRLRAEPYTSYFTERTRARDGMDPKTYHEFLARKKRLEEDRAVRKEGYSQSLTARVEDTERYDSLESGSVMVFGVGVDTYDHFPDLNYAARDAERMVAFFAGRYDLSNEWATVITNEDARAIGVRRFLEKNARKLLKPKDTFIFYFSGHGMPDIDAGSGDGDGLKKYLLLSDSEAGALPLTAISLNDLAVLLGDLPCRRVLVFIDSCFSGVAGKDVLSHMKNPLISEESYANMANLSGTGRVVMAASMENMPSLESPELESGVFTHFLIRKLQRSEREGSRIPVDIFDLYRYVADEVERFTGGRQSPVFRGELDRSILL